MAKARWKRIHRHAILWSLGILLLGQLSLGLWVDRSGPALRDPEYAVMSSLLAEKRAEHPDRKLALFLGSSRVSHGFDAREAGTEETLVVNMGIAGCGPYLQEVILDRLLATGLKPDVLFVEVMHPFFNEATGKTLDHLLLDGARLNFEEARPLLHYGRTHHQISARRWLYSRLFPTSRHQVEMQQQLMATEYRFEDAPPSPLAPIDSFGYRRKWIEPEKCRAMTKMAHDQYDGFYHDFKLAEDPYRRLLSVIDKGRHAGMEIVLVLTPEGSEFRDRFTANAVNGIDGFLKRLQDEREVRIVDARNWIDDACFYDMHHLLPEGARKFAQRFQQEVIAPYSYSSSSSR